MALTTEHVLSTANDAKLHAGLSIKLARVVCKILKIFPYLEAIQPRCMPGIQHLSALHLALDKAASLLQHCADCSKLYLAVTGDAVLAKFTKIKASLNESLRQLESMVPQKLADQIDEIAKEVEGIILELEPSEKQLGRDLITLLQKGTSEWNTASQLDIFRQTSTKLGILSQTAVLIEKRALKKLLEKAYAEEDKKKASIVSYFLHLLTLSPRLPFESLEYDFQSPVQSRRNSTADVYPGRSDTNQPESSKVDIVDARLSSSVEESLVPPEEFKCPISSKLMFDPVVIASGQTYERSCIEAWFKEGHDTCPKTKKTLPHLNITPNYCIKGLIASWCEKNGVEFPNSPGQSLTMQKISIDTSHDEQDYENQNLNFKKVDERLSEYKVNESCIAEQSLNSNTKKDMKSLTQNSELKVVADMNVGSPMPRKSLEDTQENIKPKLEQLLSRLTSSSLESQIESLEEIKRIAEENKASLYIRDSGIIPAVVKFLQSVANDSGITPQRNGLLTLLSISRNDRNKGEIFCASALSLLLYYLESGPTEEAMAVLLELSSVESEKMNFVSSGAIPCLFKLLESENIQCRENALAIIHNLSTIICEWSTILSVASITQLLQIFGVDELRGKCIKFLKRLAECEGGRALIAETEGCILAIAEVLDMDNIEEQEQAIDILYLLCANNYAHSQAVLNEGVIPSLVNISVSGSVNGMDKAQNLLELFREQRVRDACHRPDQFLNNNEMTFDNQVTITGSGTEILETSSSKPAPKNKTVFSKICSIFCTCSESEKGK